MGTSILTAVSRFASPKSIVPRSKSRLRSAPAITLREPRAFPEATTPPTLPQTIRDEVLELYAFIFRQGGFRQLGHHVRTVSARCRCNETNRPGSLSNQLEDRDLIYD